MTTPNLAERTVMAMAGEILRWGVARPEHEVLSLDALSDVGRVIWIARHARIADDVDELFAGEERGEWSLDAFGRAVRAMGLDVVWSSMRLDEYMRGWAATEFRERVTAELTLSTMEGAWS